MQEFVAYYGKVFTIEWYFNLKGESQPLDYFYAMKDYQKRKLLMLFKRLGDFGKISDKTKFRNEGNGIYAFKPQPDRFLSFFTDEKRVIVTEAYYKKTARLSSNIKERSLRIREDYINRCKEGRYYG